MSFETGIRIKKLREFRNFTQEYMAEKLAISQNTYSKIENGMSKIDTDRLERIAKVLDVPVEGLLSQGRNVFNFDNANCFIENGSVSITDDKESIQHFFSILQQQLELSRQQNELLIKAIEAFSKKL